MKAAQLLKHEFNTKKVSLTRTTMAIRRLCLISFLELLNLATKIKNVFTII